MRSATPESGSMTAHAVYQRARLNISLPHPLRQQLDEMAHQQNLSTTRLVQNILERAILEEMHLSTLSSCISRCA